MVFQCFIRILSEQTGAAFDTPILLECEFSGTCCVLRPKIQPRFISLQSNNTVFWFWCSLVMEYNSSILSCGPFIHTLLFLVYLYCLFSGFHESGDIELWVWCSLSSQGVWSPVTLHNIYRHFLYTSKFLFSSYWSQIFHLRMWMGWEIIGK